MGTSRCKPVMIGQNLQHLHDWSRRRVLTLAMYHILWELPRDLVTVRYPHLSMISLIRRRCNVLTMSVFPAHEPPWWKRQCRGGMREINPFPTHVPPSLRNCAERV